MICRNAGIDEDRCAVRGCDCGVDNADGDR